MRISSRTQRSSSRRFQPIQISGNAGLGRKVRAMEVIAYDSQGNRIGKANLSGNGFYRLVLPRWFTTGEVELKLVDANRSKWNFVNDSNSKVDFLECPPISVLIIPGKLVYDGANFSDKPVSPYPANNPPTISGTAIGSLTEDAALTSTSGVLSISDVDTGESSFKSPASLQGTYGAFSFNTTTGAWDYTLNNADPDTNALTAGQQVNDTLVVTSFDGTASQAITVTITGANEIVPNTPATISGSAAGALIEDAALTSTSGSLSVSDADTGESSFKSPASLQGTYGSFTFINATGAWGYTLENNDPDTNALTAGQQVNDTLIVTSFDGTASQAISISITGANDPGSISGTATGSLTEDAALTSTSGVLSISDVDTGESSFKSPASLQGTYGAFSFNTTTGAWGYTLNIADPDTNALAAGVTVTDTLVVTSFDGTASQTITVTVTGANDPASISGTATGALTETDGLLSTGGSLSISDVDTGESSFISRSNVAGSAGLGTFNINSAGVWTYVTNAANSADELAPGQTATDSFVVTSFDGAASQTISVTITGTERTIVVDETGAAFLDADGNGIKDSTEALVNLDGSYDFSEDQVTVTFTGVPTTANKVNLSGFGSDDKVIINYAAMTNPFGLSSGRQPFANFKTLSAGWGGLAPVTLKTNQFNLYSLAKPVVNSGIIKFNASNPVGGGKFQVVFSNAVGGIAKTTRTFATWGAGTSIPLTPGGQVTITWPTVPPGGVG